MGGDIGTLIKVVARTGTLDNSHRRMLCGLPLKSTADKAAKTNALASRIDFYTRQIDDLL
jgi:hypothetical protein